MQLDVDIEPTLRFPYMTSIDKQMDKSEGSFSPVHSMYPYVWTVFLGTWGTLGTCGTLKENKRQESCTIDNRTNAWNNHEHDETQLL